MTETWDEDKPAGSRSPTLGDDDIRELKRSLRERLAEDHQFEGAEDPAFGAVGGYQIGKHNFVTLIEQASDKVTLENEVAMEAKDLSGSPEVYLVPENAGTPLLITRGNVSKLNAITANNGTHDIAFPTNNMAAAKYMLGNSDTILWMYLNAAPPSWKVLATGADMVLGVAGGAEAYDVDGGNPDSVADWQREDHVLSAAEIAAHLHGAGTLQPKIRESGGGASDRGYTANLCTASITHGSITGSTASTGGGGAHNHGNTWRPKASVGKLFQLDTA
jgi:hypothetical protein